ncbi:MAG TPA: 4Fe-4S single cluster domain-containing protein [Terriglobia bacterium]|nr:4Fe-4S single cluster domain-containing protein [Terriglobia bacterium]
MFLHALIPASRANGPGLRAVVFFQGCDLGCLGCFNPLTHSFHGKALSVQAVAREVLRAHAEHPLEGVTFSGGEPMQQADSLLALMQGLRLRAPALSFGMFSGYTERELAAGRYSIWGQPMVEDERASLWKDILGLLDFAVLGRFNYLQPSSAPMRSSRNQILRLFSDRYTEADFSEQLVEIQIDDSGRSEITGFPVLGLPW